MTVDTLARSLASTQTLRALGPTVVGADFVPDDVRPEARSFQSLCTALHAEDLYAIYRTLSMSSHASVTLTDYYLRPDDTRPFAFSPQGGPLEGDQLVCWLIAGCLVWSG